MDQRAFSKIFQGVRDNSSFPSFSAAAGHPVWRNMGEVESIMQIVQRNPVDDKRRISRYHHPQK
jgi:hypothetical protein